MKHSIFTIIFSAFTVFAFGQQDAFAWRIGAYGGYNVYKGDLNSGVNIADVQQPLNDFPNTDWLDLLSYGLSAERSFKGFGIKLLATKGIFEANDRARNYWNNDFLENPNFERSLNVQTQLYDASLLATFYTDNGKLFSKKAIISPYFSIGFGLTQFETFGELYTSKNERYYYWSDGLIYDQPEDALPVNPIELVQNDDFETSLKDLKTEGVDYNTIVWNIPVAVGLKFRLHERLNLNLEVLGRYVNSDYLDDVSGNYPVSYDNAAQEYASNPSGQNKTQRGDNDANDFYGMASLSLHYNFGRKTEDFLPPIFYSAGDGKNTTNSTTTTKTTTTAEPIVNVNSKMTFNIDTIGLNEKIILPKIEDKPLGMKQPEIEPIKTDSIEVEGISLEKVELKTDSLKQIATKVDEEIENTITKINEKVSNPVVKENTIVKGNTAPKVTETKVLNYEEQTFLEIQKTRLEVAKLNEQANLLLKNYDATKKDSLVILNQKIEVLDKKLQGFQQYLNQLAIQGNANYAKPEVQAIVRTNEALVTENNVLKKKYKTLVLGEEDPGAIKAELAKAAAENAKNQQKIAALETQVSGLEAQKAALQNINVNVQNPNGQSPPTTTKIVTTPVIIQQNTPKPNKTNMVVVPVKSMVLDSTLIKSLPDSTAKKILAYDADMKNLAAELEQLNTIVIPEKNKTIDSLKMRMQYLQGQLDGVKSSNAELAKMFEQRIGTLQFKIANIEKQTAKPQIVEEVVVERVEVPKKNPALTIVENFKKSNVYFDNGSVNIKTEFYNRLDRVASLMNEYPELVVMLKGYTDKSGNPTTNFRLSKQRSEAVKAYLIRQGVRSESIDISYYGDNAASVSNDPFSRRVEVSLIIGK